MEGENPPPYFSLQLALALHQLINKAEQNLESNWRGGFTVPSRKLYPFQWNWDSGIVAVGMGHYKLGYAIQELDSLFSSQWENGMLPHIVFHSEKEISYFPNFDFWNSNVNSGAPKSPKSSGITQPAVHGFVLEQLLENHPNSADLKDFSKVLFPKILKYHRYLYKHRDINSEGLMFMFHPWESGRDNSPLWDNSLERILINPSDLPVYKRKDLEIADASERPTSFQYDRYVYLLEMGKRNQYEGEEIYKESPFLIQDSMMNAILIQSNMSLLRIGNQLGLDTGEIHEWIDQSTKAFSQKLWNESLGTFTPYDMIDKKQIAHKEIGGLVSLFAGLADDHQAKMMNEYLQSLHERNFYLCPSFDVDSDLFDSKRYWRGPVWPQMNWLIHKGLKQYGFDDTANIVKSDILELVEKLGFYEYFESQKDLVGHMAGGYGGDDFSWTSSCVIDLIKNK